MKGIEAASLLLLYQVSSCFAWKNITDFAILECWPKSSLSWDNIEGCVVKCRYKNQLKHFIKRPTGWKPDTPNDDFCKTKCCDPHETYQRIKWSCKKRSYSDFIQGDVCTGECPFDAIRHEISCEINGLWNRTYPDTRCRCTDPKYIYSGLFWKCREGKVSEICDGMCLNNGDDQVQYQIRCGLDGGWKVVGEQEPICRCRNPNDSYPGILWNCTTNGGEFFLDGTICFGTCSPDEDPRYGIRCTSDGNWQNVPGYAHPGSSENCKANAHNCLGNLTDMNVENGKIQCQVTKEHVYHCYAVCKFGYVPWPADVVYCSSDDQDLNHQISDIRCEKPVTLLIAGLDENGEAIKEVETYDLESNLGLKSCPIPNLPSHILNTVAIWIEGSILVCGTNKTFLNVPICYSLQNISTEWAPTDIYEYGIKGHDFASLQSQGHVLFIGGKDVYGPLNTITDFNEYSHEVSDKEILPIYVFGHCAVSNLNSKGEMQSFTVIGGISSTANWDEQNCLFKKPGEDYIPCEKVGSLVDRPSCLSFPSATGKPDEIGVAVINSNARKIHIGHQESSSGRMQWFNLGLDLAERREDPAIVVLGDRATVFGGDTLIVEQMRLKPPYTLTTASKLVKRIRKGPSAVNIPISFCLE